MAKELKINTNLFGMPFQFPSTVDPRIGNGDSGISNVIGRKFAENIAIEAPVCTFIPGVPTYLSNDTKSSKINSSIALLSGNGNFTSIGGKKLTQSDFDSMRLYDFKNDYTDYIKYVNILCRTAAVFLNLGDTTLGGTKLKEYNWKNYRWDKDSTPSLSTSVQKMLKNFKIDSGDVNDFEAGLESVLTNHYFVQFYVDSDVTSNDSFSNSTTESMMKGLLDTGSETMKQLAFMANSGIGADVFGSFVESSSDALNAGIEAILGNSVASNALSRIINLGGDALKGNNLIMPDVYQSSSYTKNYNITIHLKSPYGSKLGYYLHILVPLMHILALAIPRQASANSYESPFIVKAYVDGIFSCNMGMIESIDISRVAESYSVEGLPTEVDVSISLRDLYSGIQMSSSTSPFLFMNNSSLIEYLAVSCGLSLTSPNITEKYKSIVGSTINAILDTPDNVKTRVSENIKTWLNNTLKLYR